EIAKREQRCGQKADRQHARHHLEPGGSGGRTPRWRKCPRFVNEKVRQKQNGLNDGGKRDESGSYSHTRLDSLGRKNGICLLPGLRPAGRDPLVSWSLAEDGRRHSREASE